MLVLGQRVEDLRRAGLVAVGEQLVGEREQLRGVAVTQSPRPRTVAVAATARRSRLGQPARARRGIDMIMPKYRSRKSDGRQKRRQAPKLPPPNA